MCDVTLSYDQAVVWLGRMRSPSSLNMDMDINSHSTEVSKLTGYGYHVKYPPYRIHTNTFTASYPQHPTSREEEMTGMHAITSRVNGRCCTRLEGQGEDRVSIKKCGARRGKKKSSRWIRGTVYTTTWYEL